MDLSTFKVFFKDEKQLAEVLSALFEEGGLWHPKEGLDDFLAKNYDNDSDLELFYFDILETFYDYLNDYIEPGMDIIMKKFKKEVLAYKKTRKKSKYI